MSKKIAKISVLPIFLALVTLSFSNKENSLFGWGTNKDWSLDEEYLTSNLNLSFTVDSLYQGLPLLQNDFIGFKEAIGHSESRGQYHLVNKFGYMGKYQFGKSALAAIGIYNTQEFIEHPELQEAAFTAYVSLNKWNLRNEIAHYEGQVIDGILITEAGIIGAAHLGGPTGVKRFLRSGGQIGKRDAFGTHIKEYLRRFSPFDISEIPAEKNIKVDPLILRDAFSREV